MKTRSWQIAIPSLLIISTLFWVACSRPTTGQSGTDKISLIAAANAPRTQLSPTSQDRNIAKTISYMLRSHFSGKELDSSISERALELYFKSLDPAKMYFYQSDIDAFTAKKPDVADMLRKGDLSLAFDIYNVFLDRVDEKIGFILNEILLEGFDFTADEQMLRDRKLMTFAKNPEESKDRWRKRVKFDLLMLKSEARDKEKKSSSAVAEDPIARLKRRYLSLKVRMRQSTNDEVIETFLSAVTNGLDPHTSYMSPSSFENFMTMMRLNLEGIGATLQSVDGYTVIKNMLPGGAAEKDGRLKIEDKIIGVGQGKNGEIEDVVDMKLTDVVSRIRGPKGTVVRLEVLPDDGSDKKILEIAREKVQLEDCKSIVFEAGAKPDGTPYKIGIIDLPSFYLDIEALNKGDANAKSTVRDVRAILKNFVKENVDAVVLDLRLNGGGSLPEAVSLTGLFIETGSVVQVKADGQARSLDDTDSGVEWTGPLAVLTSKFSASASEILAGAIKDYKRGLVIGDATTHGKGSVQTLMDLNEKLFSSSKKAGELGALKLTIQMFYRPDGESTQIQGVESDIELPSVTNHIEGISESDLDYPLPAGKIKAVKHAMFPYVSEELVDVLREKSAARIKENEKFLKTIRDIDLYLELKKQPMQTLNEDKFFAERDRLNADKETDKLEKKMYSHEIERDHYMEEIMAITIDSVETLRKQGVEYPKERTKQGGRMNLFNMFGG